MAKVTQVNVREIAKVAGVSHITVSRALRSGQHVAEETRKRILEIAETMGYRSNPLVQAYTAQIRRSRREDPACNLAWLPSDPDNRSMHQQWVLPYTKGAKRRAVELGFSMDETLNAYGFDDLRLQKILESRGVRGVIIPHIAYHTRSPFHGKAIAAVGIGECPDARPMHTVSPDYFKNITTAFDALLLRGYRRIAFCEHDHATVTSQGMHWGGFLFNRERLDAQLPMLGNVGLTDARVAKSRDRFLRWFEKEAPDAVLTTFFHVGLWLSEAGVRVPDQVGLAHLSISGDVEGWSGIDGSASAVGAAAVDLLVAQILRNEYEVPDHPKFIRLAGAWVDGNTTRPAPRNVSDLPVSHTHPHDWFEEWFWNRSRK